MTSPEVRFKKLKTTYRRYRILQDIEQRKYYEGFKVGWEKKMFEEELKDVEKAYRNTLEDLHKQVEDCLPSLLHYMEEFVTLHKLNETTREKLDVLLDKMGKQEDNEEDYE